MLENPKYVEQLSENVGILIMKRGDISFWAILYVVSLQQ